MDGVTVCYFRSGVIKNVSLARRAINETLLSCHAWYACRAFFSSNPHDLIIYYSPTIFWGLLVQRLKKLWGASSYLILRDIFPQWVIDNGILSPRSPVTMYLRYFEHLNYRVADRIGLQSPLNLEWFARTYGMSKQLDVVYNWSVIEEIGTKGNEHRVMLGLEDKVVYFYGGNIGHAQDMMNIVRLAKRMRENDRAHFLLVGTGDEVELVRMEIQKNSLTNMTVLPPVTQDEYRKIMAECDVGLFTLHRDHVTHNFPGKLLGYMALEKPILGSVNSGNDLKEVLEDSGAGLVTVSGDDDGLFANAMRLLHDNELRKRAGNAARQLLISTFSVELAARSILRNAERRI
jgi:glycosyltransferase involved in cell wall biosynthesis